MGKLLSTPEERDLECLCNLLKTVGKTLETDQAAKVFATYFERIREFSVNEALPQRIRFMLQVRFFFRFAVLWF